MTGSQAEWDKRRREVKARAAETMKANAEQAAADLKAYREGLGYPAPAKPVVEEDEEVSAYEGHTVDELKALLAERDLAVSGNKAELIARLEESDTEDPDE